MSSFLPVKIVDFLLLHLRFKLDNLAGFHVWELCVALICPLVWLLVGRVCRDNLVSFCSFLQEVCSVYTISNTEMPTCRLSLYFHHQSIVGNGNLIHSLFYSDVENIGWDAGSVLQYRRKT